MTSDKLLIADCYVVSPPPMCGKRSGCDWNKPRRLFIGLLTTAVLAMAHLPTGCAQPPDENKAVDNKADDNKADGGASQVDSADTASDPLAAQQQIAHRWEASIRPLLAKNCLSCHDAVQRSGNLELETIAGLFRGGLSGSAIDTDKPAESLLIEVLAPQADNHMPPKGQLSDTDIELVKQWVAAFQDTSLADAWRRQDPSPNGSSLAQRITTDSDSELWSRLPMGLNPSQVIDLAIQAEWQINGIPSAPLTTDAAFGRRLYLDLIGRIPTESELNDFVNQSDSRKREHLVDRLLDSDEHAEHLAEVLDAILMGRQQAGRGSKRDKTGWLGYLTTRIRGNKPWNEVAREIILARPTNEEGRGAVWYLHARQNKHQDIAEAISKDFFGVRIDCAQCHDHPLASEIEQRHYWGLVAFFNRSTNIDTPNGPRIAESAIGGFSEFTNIRGKSSQNQLVYLRAEPVEEARPAPDAKEEDREDLYIPGENGEPKVPKFSRRQQFVDQVLDGNPLVAQAMVNRMWGWMFGRGIVHPVDALDSFHPASHPGLLDWLARDFANSNYDLRRLIRHLALSRTYQLDSTPLAGADPKWFTYAQAKPLTAESLYRSFQVALDVVDPNAWNSPPQRNAFAALFPDVLTEESLANVSQGLWLTNGEAIQKMVSAEHSKTVQQVLKIEENDQLVQRLFQLILGRSVEGDEAQQCVEFLSVRDEQRQSAVESLSWALITSAEFRFNH